MASYPNSIYTPRERENRSGVVYDPAKKSVWFKEDADAIENEIIAIENELGLLPKNSSSSVRERIKGFRSLDNAYDDVVIVKENKVGIGAKEPSQNLEVNGAVRFAPMSAPANPLAGTLYFDSATGKFKYYNGSAWKTISSN